MEIFVYCHASAVIQRPPTAIWPYLYDRFAWMSTPGTRKVVAGTPGQVGEVAEVVTQEGDYAMRRTERILAAEAPQRFVTAIVVNEDGVNMVSFVHWELSQGDGGIRADLNVTLTGKFDQAGLVENLPADPQSFYQMGTQAKINAEIARLKSFMERSDA